MCGTVTDPRSWWAAVLHMREIALLLHGARGPPTQPSPPGQLSFLNFDA